MPENTFERRNPVGPEPEIDFETEPHLPGFDPQLPEVSPEVEKYVHEHQRESMFGGAYEQTQKIIELLKKEEDEDGLKLVGGLLKSVGNYCNSIFTMETQTKMLRFRYDGDDLADRISKHDRHRKRAHDALIADLTSCVRYLNKEYSGKVPSTGIYNGEESHLINSEERGNRTMIGDWAVELEHEILLSRQR